MTTLVSTTTRTMLAAPLSSRRSDLGIDLRYAHAIQSRPLGSLPGLLQAGSQRVEEPSVFVGIEEDGVAPASSPDDDGSATRRRRQNLSQARTRFGRRDNSFFSANIGHAFKIAPGGPDAHNAAGTPFAHPPVNQPAEEAMSGLGGLNKSPDGVVIGLVQLQLPSSSPRRIWRAQTERICRDGRQGAAQPARPWTWWCSPNIRCTACRWAPIRRSCAGSTAPRSSVPAGLHRQQHLGLLLDHGVQPGRQSLQHRPHHRRRGRDPALLPQAASLGPGRAVGAGRSRHPGVRRTERQRRSR